MKVAIVNDSKMAAEILRRILASLPDFELAWIAYSGEEAIEKSRVDHPDIILMDLIMPGIDGAETTRRIMQSTPSIILVVTATTVGNRAKVFEAMGHGALDAVNTPVLGKNNELDGAETLVRKLRVVSRLVTRSNTTAPRHPQESAPDTSKYPVIAIGASTGGPQALSEILSNLPADLPAIVLIVQHVDEKFATGLAEWLQLHSRLPIAVAKDGDRPLPGSVWLAGGHDHMQYDNGVLRYTSVPADNPNRPSVDVLFSSLAKPHRALRIGALLTGMGRDGSAGLLAMRQSGALTIAQDAATSIVYGMPRAAAEMNAAREILPLKQIAARITKAILQPDTSFLPAAPVVRSFTT